MPHSISPRFIAQYFSLEQQATVMENGVACGIDLVPGHDSDWFALQGATEKHAWYGLQDAPGQFGPPIFFAFNFASTSGDTRSTTLRIRRLGWKVPVRYTWDEETWDEDPMSGTYHTILGPPAARSLTLAASAGTTSDYVVGVPGADRSIRLSNFKLFAPWV